MDYEKKYKEALELARVAAFNGHQSLMEGIFPELAESEDEKIKHEIKVVLANTDLSQFALEYTFADMLAWLENIPYTIDHEKREGFHLGYKAALEKQGETVWSEETDDDAWLNDIISKVESGCTLNSSEIKWLKSIKDKINIHYWTEEEIDPSLVTTSEVQSIMVE